MAETAASVVAGISEQVRRGGISAQVPDAGTLNSEAADSRRRKPHRTPDRANGVALEIRDLNRITGPALAGVVRIAPLLLMATGMGEHAACLPIAPLRRSVAAGFAPLHPSVVAELAICLPIAPIHPSAAARFAPLHAFGGGGRSNPSFGGGAARSAPSFVAAIAPIHPSVAAVFAPLHPSVVAAVAPLHPSVVVGVAPLHPSVVVGVAPLRPSVVGAAAAVVAASMVAVVVGASMVVVIVSPSCRCNYQSNAYTPHSLGPEVKRATFR